ncbi:alpha-D-ribose 1-methylphosphonate 5-triphosphate diphosphatase [Glaciihabitans tibetensis]|uniref:Alpha-D-ribose 1-methylphosphonate 5-triphosphate diphosphatase n=1 Tax=Glaciihabitans tibetensis TaxID=1266600 RepID=A0A2T0VEM6_9MICO|nr:alpha-D-ribose 1-methylphosphonate 5-triphosphate diphosphatase [Glaciihabitans tibetensis]PRY68614.1 alpha-D-ribose 1-methylphosphonate 5-triphosphate diphosphatase [Glaciihabitans tibetensis]
MSFVLSNAHIVLPDRVMHGSVHMDNGIIVEVSDDPHLVIDGVPTEDLGADYLLPGLVELHTDQVESHYQPRPKRFWDPIPAVIAHDAQMAASGVTTVLDALRIGSGPGENRISGNARTLVNAVIHAAESGLLRADHYVHLRCEVATPDVVEVFDEVGGHERVRMVSLMDHTPGQRQYADVESFRTYMVGKHSMSNAQFDEHVAELHVLSSLHSDDNRRLMAERARERGITIAAHDDATQEHVDESAAAGVRISEFPTTIVAARAARAAGQLVVMGAPNIVRGGSHSGNVAAADLLRLGLLDILSSDYVPASPLQAVFLLFGRGEITLPQGAALVSANPARAAGLDDRGVIAVGKRADVLRVQTYAGASLEQHPLGSLMPIVRGVWRQGGRVA